MNTLMSCPFLLNALVFGRCIFACALVWLLAGTAGAQGTPGSNDAAFNTVDSGLYGDGSGALGEVRSLALQPDGRLLIGGDFSSYNGTARGRIARLHADGSLDGSFLPVNAPNNLVRALALQSDGKVVLAGDFTSLGGISANRIGRLNSDGSPDPSFQPGSGANFSIYAVATQPDGRLVIGGSFSQYAGIVRGCVARLHADGSLDTSFDPGSGANNQVTALCLQPDGKILIAGMFGTVNGVARNRIARLNGDGSLDTSFQPGTGAGSSVEALALQSDGKVLIGGIFSTFNGVPRSGVARLNGDGSLDLGFDPGTGANNTVHSLAPQPDGKVLIGGNFTAFGGTSRIRLARTQPDGSLDPSFNPGSGADNRVYALGLQGDGRVAIAGAFLNVGGFPRGRITRLNIDGTLDLGFNPGTGANNGVLSVALQPDGRLLAAGSFTTFNGSLRNRIVRLNEDGSIDAGFDPGLGANDAVRSLAVQPDGMVLIGGNFTSFNGLARNRIARLAGDGSLDPLFLPGVGANESIRSVALQPDGKILIAGMFSNYNGTSRGRIARIHADGSLDASFNPGSGANSTIESLVLQADGKVLIAGSFALYNGTARNRVARVNSDGTLDTSFDPGSGASALVNTLTLQPDGKVLIGGTFTSYNGTTQNRIARVNGDGSLDATFLSGTAANNWVYAFGLQADGKILVGGEFTLFSGATRNRVARLHGDGTLDPSFDPGTGASDSVRSLALQPDGRLLVGGLFTAYGGAPRNRLARAFAYDPFTEFCFGDGSAGAACPCANAGLGGRGCENSAGTGGGQLAASGGPGDDTVVLTASELLPTALTIFLQGSSALATPAVFGDGLRCVGGALKRLYVKPASGGVAAAPGAGEPSVRTQSAALGDPIAPGTTRHYQAYYRDANASFCPAPAGSTFNITQALGILWP